MGDAEVVPPASPPAPTFYDQAKFDHNFPTWAKVVAAGTKTAEDYVAFNATRGTPLTDAQAAQLRAVKVDKGADATDVQVKTPAATPTQPVEAPDLERRIEAAESQDALTALDEHIGAVADHNRRAALVALVNERREKLPPF